MLTPQFVYGAEEQASNCYIHTAPRHRASLLRISSSQSISHSIPSKCDNSVKHLQIKLKEPEQYSITIRHDKGKTIPIP